MSSAPSRRTLLGGVGASVALLPLACGRHKPTAAPREPLASTDFELSEISLAELAEQMSQGVRSSQEITALYLARIEATNVDGPKLRAVIESNPQAMAIAARLDQERLQGRLRGPLHGIPVLLKDNIATADKMQTTAGSLALLGHRPSKDSEVARRLREAGAVLLGKANLSEWANIRSSRSSSGWSARGGLCRSPYVLERNPCGSSSGSGVAAAASLCGFSIGTETDGSIVCPASHNSVVGIKPSVGAISRSGIIPISSSQDTAGPMARSVADAALVLAALIGSDPSDEATRSAPHAQMLDDLRAPLQRGALRGARIGVARELFGFHEGVDKVMEESLQALRAAGAQCVDPVAIPTDPRMGELELDVLLTELKATLADYLATLGPTAPKSLTDLIAFNRKHAEQELAHFGQELFEQAETKPSLDSNLYRDNLAALQRAARQEGLDRALSEHSLDAIVAPTNGPAWVTDLINGDHFGGGSSTFAAVAGYPNITVPAGFVGGLPVGLSIFGARWSDAKLLRLAYDFEQERPARRSPTFASMADRG